MKKCPRCGGQGRDGSRICKQCGSILVETAGEVVPSTVTDSPPRPAPEQEPEPAAAHDAVSLEPPPGNWSCVKCGERHPQRALVCWRCGTDAWGREDPDFLKEEAAEQLAPARIEAEPVLHAEEVPFRSVAQCERCRSRKVITDVEIGLQVVTHGDPEAMLFTRPTVGQLRADLCGECGHVELKLMDPAAFYRAHLAAMERKREAGR